MCVLILERELLGEPKSSAPGYDGNLMNRIGVRQHYSNQGMPGLMRGNPNRGRRPADRFRGHIQEMKHMARSAQVGAAGEHQEDRLNFTVQARLQYQQRPQRRYRKPRSGPAFSSIYEQLFGAC